MSNDSYTMRRERGEELLRIVWGREVEGDDRESAAKDAISDVLTALLGAAGYYKPDDGSGLYEAVWNHDRINEAARIVDGALRSYEGDAEDYGPEVASEVRRQLVVRYDITGLPQHEIDGLCGEAEAQAEASSDYTEDEPGTGHRDVAVKTIIEEGGA